MKLNTPDKLSYLCILTVLVASEPLQYKVPNRILQALQHRHSKLVPVRSVDVSGSGAEGPHPLRGMQKGEESAPAC